MIIHSERRLRSSGTVGGTTDFEMITDVQPSDDQVVEAQLRMEYHPAGYGGPWSTKTVKQEDGTFKTTWSCSGSCD